MTSIPGECTDKEAIMNLTTVEGMQSEIFVPITSKPVFTELKKPLSECKVAFITAGGIHKRIRHRLTPPATFLTGPFRSIRRLTS